MQEWEAPGLASLLTNSATLAKRTFQLGLISSFVKSKRQSLPASLTRQL